jgi:glycosyltransferase involved in cell wall biosynthesis
MRVALAVYGRLGTRSGGFRYDRRLVEGLRAAGDSVTVVELPWRSYGRGLLDNLDSRFVRRFPDADVILQDELAHPSLVGTNRRLSTPVVSVVHHLRASEGGRMAPLYRRVERAYLDTLAGAVCNSTATRDSVTDLGVPAPDTVVAPPAGDRFDPEIDAGEIAARAAERPLRLVFVGGLTPRKGLDTLVEGLAAADADAELTVVGRPREGDYTAAVRRLIRRRGLGGRVRMAGELADPELESVLRSSHALAVPSRYEGFGIVYLEGMSFGLPALASRAGGASDVVTDGEDGLLVPPDSPSAVARAIEELDDPDRLAAMGVTARERYERHPGWGETTERVRGLLAPAAEGAT